MNFCQCTKKIPILAIFEKEWPKWDIFFAAAVCLLKLTTRAALSCDSHFRQNHGPEGTCTMP